MSILLYGYKNYKGKCVTVNKDYSDLKDTVLNYRASSAQLTRDSDKALFYKEKYWKGDLMFRTGKLNISDISNPDRGGMPKFNNEIKSVRITPFRIKIKYHFIYTEGDLPGDHKGVFGFLTIAKHIDDLHSIVQDIWEPYLINFEKETLLGFYENDQYFELDVATNELTQLKQDPDMQFPNTCLNVVLVEDVINGSKTGTLGVAKNGDLLRPVVVVELRAETLLFTNARTIAHEIGHAFGLDHGNNTNPNRLMTQTGEVTGDIEQAVRLSQPEVEIVHAKLAQHDGINPLLRFE